MDGRSPARRRMSARRRCGLRPEKKGASNIRCEDLPTLRLNDELWPKFLFGRCPSGRVQARTRSHITGFQNLWMRHERYAPQALATRHSEKRRSHVRRLMGAPIGFAGRGARISAAWRTDSDLARTANTGTRFGHQGRESQQPPPLIPRLPIPAMLAKRWADRELRSLHPTSSQAPDHVEPAFEACSDKRRQSCQEQESIKPSC